MAVKLFNYDLDGLAFEVLVDETGHVKITCTEGHADLNALYWGDGIADAVAFDLGTKKDNSLNMNGSGMDLDGGLKLSSTGLGSAGTDKPTYLVAGESYETNIDLGANGFGGFDALKVLIINDACIGRQLTTCRPLRFGNAVVIEGSQSPEAWHALVPFTPTCALEAKHSATSITAREGSKVVGYGTVQKWLD
jgi:hypothetical protein